MNGAANRKDATSPGALTSRGPLGTIIAHTNGPIVSSLHRDQAVCKQCHGVIDPTGLALENFDAIGQYRTTDRQAANAKIDASTVMPNGVAIDGPVQLRQELAKNPEKFVTAMTEKLLMYALGRNLQYYDAPSVRAIVRGAAGSRPSWPKSKICPISFSPITRCPSSAGCGR